MIASFIYKPNIENMKIISILSTIPYKKSYGYLACCILLIFCILMDFPIQINPIKWDCPLYIYGVTGWNFLVMMYLTHKVQPIFAADDNFKF